MLGAQILEPPVGVGEEGRVQPVRNLGIREALGEEGGDFALRGRQGVFEPRLSVGLKTSRVVASRRGCTVWFCGR